MSTSNPCEAKQQHKLLMFSSNNFIHLLMQQVHITLPYNKKIQAINASKLQQKIHEAHSITAINSVIQMFSAPYYLAIASNCFCSIQKCLLP
jgi:hypothetical protein